MKYFIPLLVVVLPTLVMAQLPPAPTTLPTVGVTSLSSVGTFICDALSWAFYFLLVFAVLFIVLAAFKYLTSASNPDNIVVANKQLLYAAIAVAVAIFAKAIPFIVGTLLGVTALQGC